MVASWGALLKNWKTLGILLLLTFGALLVHGYHPFAEDAEIYLPGVKKILNPALYPKGAEFFENHAHLTLFPNLIAYSVRLSHLPFAYVLFVWQLASIFLLLLACWQLSGRLFTEMRARWAGVAMVESLLTLPIAGTALYIVDQYVVNRNLSAFAAVFAITRVIERKYIRAGMWLLFAAAVHPLMVVFAGSFCVLFLLMDRWRPSGAVVACLSPFTFLFQPPSEAYHEAVRYHISHYLRNWQWYEWLGLFGPILLVWWFGRMAAKRQMRTLEKVCKAIVTYALLYFAGALIVSIPKSFETLARLQPLRSLHLVYIFMLVIGGGFLGKCVLKDAAWRWVVLFIPICAGMFFAQRALFPADAHVEWPWAAPRNPWVQAFLWARDHTPNDAFFALDPFYMQIDGEDAQGFRAIAERSRMADGNKDSGAVSMFPPLAGEWLGQFQSVEKWRNFGAADFQSLHEQYGVNWVLLQKPAGLGLDCPYANSVVEVCRVD